MVASTALVCETDSLGDAIRDLEAIHRRLATMHGADFRALDRRIEDLIERQDGMVDMHYLGGGTVMAVPGPSLTAIFQEARRLGVIV